jgi:dienelactone hydrolase
LRRAAALAVMLLVGCAARSEQISLTPVGGDAAIPAMLMKPEGAGPFPAIVLAHDCSGLGARSSGAPGRWARLLVANGYVVLIPDSFSPRGMPDGVCTLPLGTSRAAAPGIRAADAYGALAYLRSLAFVDGDRVGILGGSHGGSTTLAAMAAPGPLDTPLNQAKRHGFAAGVALYPGCAAPFGGWSAQRAQMPGPVTGFSGVYRPVGPLLILIGERDDWTPAEHCRRLVEAARAEGLPLDIRIYPGAQHAFDSNNPVRYVAERTNANKTDGKGATTGGDPAAWAAAERDALGFLAQHLKQR